MLNKNPCAVFPLQNNARLPQKKSAVYLKKMKGGGGGGGGRKEEERKQAHSRMFTAYTYNTKHALTRRT